MKSLSDSTVFQNLNQNNRVNDTIINILTKGEVVGYNDLEQAFVSIKLYKYPLRGPVMEAFEKKQIVLMFAPPNMKLTNAMPFFLQKAANGDVRAIVMVDMFGSRDKDGVCRADAKKLYTVMEAAYLAMVYSREYKSVSNRTGILKNGSTIYANMFSRVLNKKYALNSDKIKLHKVQYLASKFFMINILGATDSENISNYALSNCVGGNPIILKELDSFTDEDSFKNLSNFINTLKKPEMHLNFGDSLTTRSFIEQYIMMYDQSALLGVEIFPYFLLTVNAVVAGSYLNNQIILEDIVDKNGIKLYQEMQVLARV